MKEYLISNFKIMVIILLWLAMAGFLIFGLGFVQNESKLVAFFEIVFIGSRLLYLFFGCWWLIQCLKSGTLKIGAMAYLIIIYLITDKLMPLFIHLDNNSKTTILNPTLLCVATILYLLFIAGYSGHVKPIKKLFD